MQTTSEQPAASTEVRDLASELRLAITRMARRLRQETSDGLGPSRVSALASIARHGPLTPSELARVEAIRRPTATRLISHLEDAGYVDRSDDPEDGRSCLVAITANGQELLTSMRARKDAYVARSLAELGSEDRETLERAAEILEGMLAADEGAHAEAAG